MKRLVVTADDVGLHPGMTAGALRGHDQGIVTAASLCAVGRDLENAVAALAQRPGLDAGIHLVLVGERPLSPAARVPSLVDSRGFLRRGFRAFARRYAIGGIAMRDLETELRAQIEAILRLGVQPLHLNSHQHLHVLPRLVDIVLRLAAEYRIPWVRLPVDPALPPGAGRRGLELRALNTLGRRARRRLTAGGVRAPAHAAGIFDAGHLTRELLLAIAAQAEDSTELVCHPGIGNAALAGAYAWGYRWDEETAALCDPQVEAALAAAGVSLVGFREL